MGSKKKRTPASYTHRSYRELVKGPDLISYSVSIQQTDLHISSDVDVKKRVKDLVVQYRLQLENHIEAYPAFVTSLIPLAEVPSAPPMVRAMIKASAQAGVGPMATVAGAMSEFVGKQLLKEGVEELIIENGGDVFVARSCNAVAAIYAGESSLSCKVGVELTATKMPIGVCTSSGTVGHSLSFGLADSVTVIATSTLLADAFATRLGNEAGKYGTSSQKVEAVLQKAQGISGIEGVVVICDEKMGAFGDIKLVGM